MKWNFPLQKFCEFKLYVSYDLMIIFEAEN